MVLYGKLLVLVCKSIVPDFDYFKCYAYESLERTILIVLEEYRIYFGY